MKDPPAFAPPADPDGSWGDKTIMQLDWLRQSGRSSLRACGAVALAVTLFTGGGRSRASAAELSGEAIFKNKCAVCHGAHGEGTKKHDEPLEGSKSLPQLVDLIGKTMPEDDPGTLSKNEAEAVAHYVFDAIYSTEARERNRPARVELARLTVRQYRQAVADLVGGSSQPEWGNERGLKAEYYSGRNFRGKGKVEERVDPQVNFDFADKSPIADKIDAHEF
ncbi:MAG TPA: cytochrome c, partial [Pirellulales bacterium]